MKRLLYILVFLPLFGFGQWNDCPKNDIAHDQNFYTWDAAIVNDNIGRLNCNLNHDTISSITYAIIDTSGLFKVSGDTLCFQSITGLQTSVTYWIQIKVIDGSISDTANGYIYVFNDANGTEWNDVYSSFTGSHFYYFQRGITYEFDEPVLIDNDDIDFIAIGRGAYPHIDCNFSTGSSLPFIRTNGDDIMIYSLEFHTNNNTYISFGNYPQAYCDDIVFDNNRWIGSASYPFYNVWRYDRDQVAYRHKIMNEYARYTYEDNSWYMNISDHEVIANDLGLMGVNNDPDNYGSDGFQWAWSNGYSPGFIRNEYRDIRYNRVNHSDYRYKHAFVLGDTLYHKAYDTLVDNKVIGPGSLNGDLDYPFNGITLDRTSYAYIARNRIDSCEHGFTIAEGNSKHDTWENNVVIGARKFGLWAQSVELDSSMIRHNTFVNCASTGTCSVFDGNNSTTDTIANNIVYITSGHTNNVYNEENAVRMNNVYYDTTGTGYDIEATEIADNPDFTSSSDFTLQVGSPAIDAGEDFGVIYDFAGNIRDINPDIGAYEYQQPVEEQTAETYLDGKLGVKIYSGKTVTFLKPK